MHSLNVTRPQVWGLSIRSEAWCHQQDWLPRLYSEQDISSDALCRIPRLWRRSCCWLVLQNVKLPHHPQEMQWSASLQSIRRKSLQFKCLNVLQCSSVSSKVKASDHSLLYRRQPPHGSGSTIDKMPIENHCRWQNEPIAKCVETTEMTSSDFWCTEKCHGRVK